MKLRKNRNAIPVKLSNIIYSEMRTLSGLWELVRGIEKSAKEILEGTTSTT